MAVIKGLRRPIAVLMCGGIVTVAGVMGLALPPVNAYGGQIQSPATVWLNQRTLLRNPADTDALETLFWDSYARYERGMPQSADVNSAHWVRGILRRLEYETTSVDLADHFIYTTLLATYEPNSPLLDLIPFTPPSAYREVLSSIEARMPDAVTPEQRARADAHIAVLEDRYRQLVDIFHAQASEFPTDAYVYYRLARYAEHTDVLLSEQMYRRALALAPNNQRYLLAFADFLRSRKGAVEEALPFLLSAATSTGPYAAEAVIAAIMAARTAHDLGRYDAAKTYAAQAVANYRDASYGGEEVAASGHAVLGLVALYEGNVETALREAGYSLKFRAATGCAAGEPLLAALEAAGYGDRVRSLRASCD